MAIGLFCCSCNNKTKEVKSIPSQKSENKEKSAENNTTDVNISEADLEKGYNLPVSDQENEEAERDSFQIMEEISHIYKCADKGASLNDVLDENSIRKMVKKIKKQGYSVRTYEEYSNMENYKIVDSFLKEAQEGNMGSIAIYEVHSDGSIGREKYIYDGENMFLLNSCASVPHTPHPSTLTRISSSPIGGIGYSFSSKCSFSVNTATLAVFGIPVVAAGAETVAAAGAFPVMPERTCFTISSIFTLFMSMFFLSLTHHL